MRRRSCAVFNLAPAMNDTFHPFYVERTRHESIFIPCSKYACLFPTQKATDVHDRHAPLSRFRRTGCLALVPLSDRFYSTYRNRDTSSVKHNDDHNTKTCEPNSKRYEAKRMMLILSQNTVKEDCAESFTRRPCCLLTPKTNEQLKSARQRAIE